VICFDHVLSFIFDLLGPVVQKPVKANPGFEFKRGFYFSAAILVGGKTRQKL